MQLGDAMGVRWDTGVQQLVPERAKRPPVVAAVRFGRQAQTELDNSDTPCRQTLVPLEVRRYGRE